VVYADSAGNRKIATQTSTTNYPINMKAATFPTLTFLEYDALSSNHLCMYNLGGTTDARPAFKSGSVSSATFGNNLAMFSDTPNGNKYFVNSAGSGSISIPPTAHGFKLMHVWMIGGGGGGGKGVSGRGGGGGSGGAGFQFVVPLPSPGTSINFTIGAGGAGSTSDRW
jgi:hypothetical protein